MVDSILWKQMKGKNTVTFHVHFLLSMHLIDLCYVLFDFFWTTFRYYLGGSIIPAKTTSDDGTLQLTVHHAWMLA